MRLGFIITHQNPNSSQNSGRKLVVQRQEDKVGSFSRKVHGISVLGCWGILFIDYLEKGKTITGEYYSHLLNRLDEKICEKKPGLQKKKKTFFIRTMHPPTKVFWQWEN
jgi:hypothetical protein